MSEQKEPLENQNKKKNSSSFSPIFFEVGSGMGAIEKGIHWVTSILMLILSIVIICGVIASFLHIPRYFSAIIAGEPDSLLMLLEFVAGVIIAIELIYVIVAQNLESVIEILMIALTRELLIRYWETWEILLGILGVAILFAVKRFLLDKHDKNSNALD